MKNIVPMFLLAAFHVIAFAKEDLILIDDTNVKKIETNAPLDRDVNQIGKLLDMFYADCGRYPLNEEGLKALVEKPNTLKCRGWGLGGGKPYLESVAPFAKLKYKAAPDGLSYRLDP